MKRFITHFSTLLFVIVIFTSCNGQTSNKQTNQTVAGQQSFTSKSLRLTKTLGTSEHQNIHCSLQDKNGHLWFGTTGEGVYRYDGKEFVQFTEKDGLSNNAVYSILEDQSGNIWFGTDDGVSLFDGRTISKVFIKTNSSIGFDDIKPETNSFSVWSIYQDKKGMIWFGTSQNLYCYDGKLFSRLLDRKDIANKQNLRLKMIQCILEDHHGNIWMGSGPIELEGVIKFDGKSVSASKPNGDGWIRYIFEDKNKNIWFSGRNNGVFIYDGQTFRKFTEKENIGSAIFTDSDGNIWFDGGEKLNSIINNSGLSRYDGKTFKSFTTDDGMGKNAVWSMLQDNNGHIWIGTRNCELYRYDGKMFKAFSE